jgi:hypothetical protein
MAGPNVIESEEHALKMARQIKSVTDESVLPLPLPSYITLLVLQEWVVHFSQLCAGCMCVEVVVETLAGHGNACAD